MRISALYKKMHIYRQSRRKVLLSRSRAGNVGVSLFLFIVCFFMAFPLIYTILQSLKPFDELFAYPPRFFVKRPTLQNFKQVLLLSDNLWVPFSRHLFNSLFVTVVGTAASVIISSMAAFSLAKGKFYGKVFISQMIVWTLLFRPEVTAIPTYLVVSSLGMINTYLSLIFPPLAGTMGVFLIRQFIVTAIPDATLEAARIDGANEYRIFAGIVVPNVKPACFTMIIFSFQNFWNSTGITYIYEEKLKPLPTVLSTIAAGGFARAGAAAAVSVIMMIPPIIIFILSQSSVMETMSHSGLK